MGIDENQVSSIRGKQENAELRRQWKDPCCDEKTETKPPTLELCKSQHTQNFDFVNKKRDSFI